MALIQTTPKAANKKPPRHALFVQVCEELDLEAVHFERVSYC